MRIDMDYEERNAPDDWRSLLAGAPPVISLPTDRPRQMVQSYRPGRVRFAIGEERLKAMSACAAAVGCPSNEAMLAAFLSVLHRHAGQDDMVVGVALGAEEEPLPWRLDLSGLLRLQDLMRRITLAGNNARACPRMTLADVARRVVPVLGTRHHPMFQVAFIGGHVPHEPAAPSGATPLDLICLLEDQSDVGTLVFNAELFHETTIVRLAERFNMWLDGLRARPTIPVAAIDIVPAEERRLLTTTWNNTTAGFPAGRCLHELFEDNVRKQPGAPAVIVPGAQYSYAELDRHANRLAQYLLRLGVRPNDGVGLAVERSIDMVVGLVGIAKAGGAYVPLDPNYPQERLSLMLQDSGARILLTQRHLAEQFASQPVRVVLLDGNWDAALNDGDEPPAPAVTPSNLAYIIFTSGSTGRPKCIALDHRGRVNNFFDFNTRYAIGPGDRLLALSSLSFDMTAYDVFGTLMAGGAIVLPDAADERDPAAWARMMTDHKVTVWHSVPALLGMLVAHVEQSRLLPAGLRLVLLGGDWIPLDLPDRIKALAPGVHTVSMGGATECSMDSTIYDIETVAPNWKSIPYGVPMKNQLAFVLDSFGHLVPAGVPGELYLGGIGVAWGYLGRPDLTAARFVPHPYGEPGARLYRTGDLVRYFPDGNLELLGRIDHQVKIRGHRIELGEIVATLNLHPAVEDAVVVVRGDRAENKRLAAYVVPHAGATESLDELQSQQIEQWQSVYKETYSAPGGQDDPTFNVVGWNSSYTGLPIPGPEMKEWVDTTVERILTRKPRRVLELGCGTGLMLFRIAPHCERYVGVDFSEVAIEGIRRHLEPRGLHQVELKAARADDLDGFADAAFDCIILNSVTVIFPGIDYLLTVLEGAARLVADGGFIFVGDNRSWPHLRHLHSSIQLFQAPGGMSREELLRRVDVAMTNDPQLVVAADFYAALRGHIPRLDRVLTLLKRGRHVNELTQYRYDVFLEIGSGPDRDAPDEVLDWHKAGLTVERLRALMAERQPRRLRVNGIPNKRLFEIRKTLDLLADVNGPNDVDGLRARLAPLTPAGVDPEEIFALGDSGDFSVDVGWSAAGRHEEFDALLCRGPRSGAMPNFPLVEVARHPWREYANRPLAAGLQQKLPPLLRHYLAQRLPDYMVPSSLILLDRLPLTPNGKIDRRALPDPEQARTLAAPLVAPRTPVEEVVGAIWQEILGIRQVGVRDSFLELGGHSLLATQVQSRVHELFPFDLPLRHFLGSTTVEEQAQRIVAAGHQAGVDAEEMGRLIVQMNSLSLEEMRATLGGEQDVETGNV